MENNISLLDLEINSSAKITYINVNKNIKRRLLDLGIIENTIITPIFKSISGNPIAYEVRNIIIAIRNEDAKNIFVKYI